MPKEKCNIAIYIRTKEELETVLAECEDKCALISCIEDSHVLNVAEVPMYNQYREFALRFKDNAINLFLPRIEINKNIREYIAEELGLILYKVLKTKFDEEFIQHELYRYIPDARREELEQNNSLLNIFIRLSCVRKGNLVFIQNLMIICEGL